MAHKRTRSFGEVDDRLLHDAVHFLSSDTTSTKKLDRAMLDNHLSIIHNVSVESGLDHNEIIRLVDAGGSGKFNQAVSRRIIYSLIPSGSAPQIAAIKAVSWVCTGIPKNAVQTLLIRWVIAVYELLDGYKEFHSVYSFLFQFLGNEVLSPYAAHLLYLMTQRSDVKRYRVQILLRLQRTLTSPTHITGLLTLYQMYSPHLIVISLKSNKKFFPNVEKTLTDKIYNIQSTNQRVSASERRLLVLNDVQSTARHVVKRQRIDLNTKVIPSSDLVQQLHSGAPKVTLQLNHRTKFSDLVRNLPNLEDLPQARAILMNRALQHVLCMKYDPSLSIRFSYWLHHTLVQEFFSNSKIMLRDRQKHLLSIVYELSTFLQTGIPAVESFLQRYLRTWNGLYHRSDILRLITRCSLQPYTILYDFILEPLRKLFFCSSVFFKCQILWCLHELLKNFTSTEYSRFIDKNSQNNYQSVVFESSMDTDFNPFLTISQLCEFIFTLVRLGLIEERQHLLLVHSALDIVDTCSVLCRPDSLPLVILPPTDLITGCLFSNDAIAINRICNIMINYRAAVRFLSRTPAVSLPESEQMTHKESLQCIPTLNAIILMMCDNLLRGCGFGSHESYADIIISADQVRSLCLPGGSSPDVDVSRLLDVQHHYALLPWIVRFMKERLPEEELLSHEFVYIKNQREPYLLYLRDSGLTAVEKFFTTFIRQKRQNRTLEVNISRTT